MRVLCVAIAVLVAQTAGAGTRIETETRRLGVESPRVERAVLRIEGNRMRLDADGERGSVIYRGDRDLAWLLNHQERSYLRVDRETTAAIASGRERTNAALREGIAGMSPERRASLERLLDSTLGPVSAPPPITARSTGRRDSIQGVPCEELEIYRGEQRFARVCAADYAAAGLAPATRDAFRALAGFLRDSVSAVAPNAYRQQGLEALDSFDRVPGFPLRVRAAMSGIPPSETVVTKIVAEPIDAAAFELPTGYSADLTLGSLEGTGAR